MIVAQNLAKAFTQISALTLVLLTVSCSEPAAPVLTIKVGSGTPAGIYDDLARTFARIVNEHEATTGIHIENISSAGSVANINSVIAGEYQFGIAQADDQFNAVNGLGEWADAGPQEDLRSIVAIYSELVTLVAAGDSGILSISDLRGKKVDLGLAGSGTRQNAIDALEAAGIDWQADLQLSELGPDDRLAAFLNEELDAFFFTVGHPSTEIKFATFARRGARLISLDNIDTLLTEHSYYANQTIPLGSYPRALNEASTRTVGVRAVMLTSANVPDDVVYAVTKTAFENSEKFPQYFPAFAELRSGDILEGLEAPLHPGALRYLQEAGIGLPQEP